MMLLVSEIYMNVLSFEYYMIRAEQQMGITVSKRLTDSTIINSDRERIQNEFDNSLSKLSIDFMMNSVHYLRSLEKQVDSLNVIFIEYNQYLWRGIASRTRLFQSSKKPIAIQYSVMKIHLYSH